MGKVTLAFPLPDSAARVEHDRITIRIAEGASLIASVPTWVKDATNLTLEVSFETTGSPDAKPLKPSVSGIHETTLDGGQQERQNGGTGESGGEGVQTKDT